MKAIMWNPTTNQFEISAEFRKALTTGDIANSEIVAIGCVGEGRVGKVTTLLPSMN
jgi:hypothetical protein